MIRIIAEEPCRTIIFTRSWHRKLILTNFNRIKLNERAYIKYEISTLI